MAAKQVALLCFLILPYASGCSDRSTAPGPTADTPSATETTAGNAASAEPQRSPTPELAGTRWELLKIQSMDDTEWVPQDPSGYTLTLEPDGRAYMGLDCNSGNAKWFSEEPGRIAFTLVASTRALCQDDGLGERYARQFEYVRSYVLRDGHLFLATMADGAIIEFRPVK